MDDDICGVYSNLADGLKYMEQYNIRLWMHFIQKCKIKSDIIMHLAKK